MIRLTLAFLLMASIAVASPTWATSAAEDLSVADGDRFAIECPIGQDDTWAGIALTIKGMRAI